MGAQTSRPSKRPRVSWVSDSDEHALVPEVADTQRLWINIAGTRMQATRHTLCALGPCYFTSYLTTRVPTSDEIFIETSPAAFEVVFGAMLVAQASLANAIHVVHDGIDKFGHVLRHLLDFLMLGWTLGRPLHLPASICTSASCDTAAFFKAGDFLDQEFISLELGLRSHGVQGGVFEYLRSKRQNPCAYCFSADGSVATRGTVHVSAECNSRDTHAYIGANTAKTADLLTSLHSRPPAERRVAVLSELYNDGDQSGEGLNLYLEEADFEDGVDVEEDLDGNAAASRLIFDLGPRFMLRLQGALIGLTSNTAVPCKCSVRLDIADSRAELEKTRRPGGLGGALHAFVELLPNYGVDETNKYHFRHSLAKLQVQGHRPLGRLLAVEVWSCASCRAGNETARLWRLSAMEVFGDLIELPDELSCLDSRHPFCFDERSTTCCQIHAQSKRA